MALNHSNARVAGISIGQKRPGIAAEKHRPLGNSPIPIGAGPNLPMTGSAIRFAARRWPDTPGGEPLPAAAGRPDGIEDGLAQETEC